MIAPSILAADFSNLKHDIEMVNSSKAEWFHIDVMDGVFVPNISFGLPVLKAIKKIAKKPLDVHLMIVQPERYIKDFKNAGADILTVHLEACIHLHRTIQEIHSEGMLAGIALNPHTPVSSLKDIIQDVDLICLMSVNPGFGGQTFITKTFDKIKELKQLISETNSKAKIEVDGGVNIKNVEALKSFGADILVAGNAVFKSESPKKMIDSLHNA
ncbi:MAG: ribulose-phosphate 3-epimerase [Schleiferiaceae bacterium]|jgi:ribulose-phosphate 3-epimerase|nr:MAG: ribulose-phosphate 3-epimerase [Owenweeksia sp. TMED14]|tara:strand:- start:14422 stop:15063 length:642 start_codon:yes stop_codon:yes gene_type:complete